MKKYLSFPLEIKEFSEDEDGFCYFAGYASTFGNVDRGNDVMVKGCFSESIAKITPSLLWQHKMHEPIGIFTSVSEDGSGLFVRGKMPKEDTFVKGRVIPQMKCGSVGTMSIGFSANNDGDYEYKDGICYFKRVDLWEISLVTIPMNGLAVITELVKSLSDNEKEEVGKLISGEKLTIEEAKQLDKRSLEKFLREAGASKSAAVFIASKTTLKQGEPDLIIDEEQARSALNTIQSIKNMLLNQGK